MKGTDNRVTDNRVKGTDVVLKGIDSCRVGHCTEGAAAAGRKRTAKASSPISKRPLFDVKIPA